MAETDTTLPSLIYTIHLAAGAPTAITVHAGANRPKTIASIGPLDQDRSPVGEIASAILTHYLRATEHLTSEAAADRARSHKTALSRVISARLAHATAAATLTASDIAGYLMQHVFSPPADHWVERYSVPSSDGERLYTVAKKDDGTWGCTCPHYTNRHVACKHIQAAQARPAWYPYQARHDSD